MRSTLLAWSLAALFTLPAFAAPSSTEKKASTVLPAAAVKGETKVGDGEAVKFTTFNGVKVPPMIEIEGDKFEETIKSGYW